MKLQVLGSSSSGNGYILKSDSGQVLIIEAGLPLQSVKEALNFDLTKIVGCICTHEHGDHFKYASQYMTAGIDVCSSVETLDTIEYSHRMRAFINKKSCMIGEFKIMPVEVKHDVHCFSFLISHPESGLVFFCTDTMYVPFKIPGLNHAIIECNYSQEILDSHDSEDTVTLVRNRVIGSHMSLRTCKDFLRANDLKEVRTITLIHLSSSNSNSSQFKSEIEGITGKQVYIADKNIIINLNLNQF